MPTFAFLQAAQVSSALPGGKAQEITVTVPLSGNVTEAVVRALLAELGLRGETRVTDFNRQAGYNLLRHAVTQLQGQRVFTSQIEAARRQGRRELTITVAVAVEIVNDVRRFLSLPPLASGAGTGATRPDGQGSGGSHALPSSPSKPVSKMTTAERLGEAIRRSIPMLPADAREEVEALLTPEALAIMAGVLVLWVVSHFFGIGEVADVVLLVVGAIALGGVAVRAAEELYGFASNAINASRDEDLDRAAKHFSEAVSLIGIQAVMVILLKKAPKTFRKPYNNATPYTLRTVPQAPRTPGKLFYRPKVTAVAGGRAGEGLTTAYGDVYYSSRGSAEAQRLARVHEKVHSFLSPKLQILREVRVVLSSNGYIKSHLLRYLEEALAETVAQVTVRGWREARVGITFPVKNGYVTVAEMKMEAAGIVLGPINVGGMIYKAVFSYVGPSREGWREVKPGH